MLIDLHTHSYPRSDDSFMSVDELIQAAKARGLDGVCLTEHDAFWSEEEIRTLSRRHDFLVLGGAELNTDPGHVLVFGLERYEFGMHKPAVLRAKVDQVDGVIIGAHPYRRRFLTEAAENPEARKGMLDRAADDQFFSVCDAVEGVNGRGKPAENLFSQELAARLNLHVSGGSDAHKLEQMGSAATRFESKICNLEDLILELRMGRFEAVVLPQS